MDTAARPVVPSPPGTRCRLCIGVRGLVQGIGFRPFIYRLATDMQLTGFVQNSSAGVAIEVEGEGETLRRFLERLTEEKPAFAILQSVEPVEREPVGYTTFAIKASRCDAAYNTMVLPDMALCADCLRELFEPENRRYRYPFINCTHCGPRYSIIERLPYDRPHTTMRAFPMCPQCRAEYEDPRDRRFHAQPIACPECGPELALWDRTGRVLETRHAALRATVEAIRAGRIAAVKGLGGFHLVADARDDGALQRLRDRKGREEKPFALMYPDMNAIRVDCEVTALEEQLLRSPEAPIVLLRRKPRAGVANGVAPGHPDLGVMLPYTPLHHLLLREWGASIVATSGNVSDDPICKDERAALAQLDALADLFLVHNRPIAHHVDDSVVRVIAGRPTVLRRARGYAPLPHDASPLGGAVVAVGADLKNTVACAQGSSVYISPHIGDLETEKAHRVFEETLTHFERLFCIRPAIVAHDAHPDYRSTRYARCREPRNTPVQHHHAHIVSCMAEHGLDGSVLGVAWDGTGYGWDGTIWGGEFLIANREDFTRLGHLRSFRLPGGEKAIREPRRIALSLLLELYGPDAIRNAKYEVLRSFTSEERSVLLQMWLSGIHSPLTSSAGRLFDAVSALLGLCSFASYEGQAAIRLEQVAGDIAPEESYPVAVEPYAGADGQMRYFVEWRDAVLGVLGDQASGMPLAVVATKFHQTMTEAIVRMAAIAGQERVALSGGCFQNKVLSESAIRRLQEEGHRVFWHQRVPPNDGGIALGQAVVAARRQAVGARGSSPDARKSAKVGIPCV